MFFSHLVRAHATVCDQALEVLGRRAVAVYSDRDFVRLHLENCEKWNSCCFGLNKITYALGHTTRVKVSTEPELPHNFDSPLQVAEPRLAYPAFLF